MDHNRDIESSETEITVNSLSFSLLLLSGNRIEKFTLLKLLAVGMSIGGVALVTLVDSEKVLSSPSVGTYMHGSVSVPMCVHLHLHLYLPHVVLTHSLTHTHTLSLS